MTVDTPSSRRFELRGRVPVRVWGVLAVIDLVGLILLGANIAWPATALLVVGLALVVLGIVLAIVLMVVLGRMRQVVELDDAGIHVHAPRPNDIGWREVSAVRTDGRVLRVELKDRTQLVINAALFRHGYPALEAALLDRLRTTEGGTGRPQ